MKQLIFTQFSSMIMAYFLTLGYMQYGNHFVFLYMVVIIDFQSSIYSINIFQAHQG